MMDDMKSMEGKTNNNDGLKLTPKDKKVVI